MLEDKTERLIYIAPSFVKNLSKITKESDNVYKNATILGFHMHFINPDIPFGRLSNPTYLERIENLFAFRDGDPSNAPINDNRKKTPTYRPYNTNADFYNINELSNELLLSSRLLNFNGSGSASLIVFTYELLSNEPLNVNTNGLHFSKSLNELRTLDFVLDNQGYSNITENVAFIFQWVSKEGQGSGNYLTTFSSNETFRLYLDLHKYKITSNLVTVTSNNGQSYDNIDLGHAHGIWFNQGIENQLLYIDNTNFNTKKMSNDVTLAHNNNYMDNVAVSPLTLLTVKSNYGNINYSTNDNIMVYEDWDSPLGLGLTDVIL